MCLFLFSSCVKSSDKTWGDVSFSSPVKIIFDTDMLTDCDDAAALGMLHKLADAGEAEILATMVTSSYPMSAPVVEAINTYYNRPGIPIGVPKNGRGVYRDDSSFLDSVAWEFPHTLRSNADAPDAVTLYRDILSKQSDHSVVILTVGYMSNLAPLLQSEGDRFSPLNGFEMVKKKVKIWICMGGNFPVDDASDNVNFTRDAAAAVYALTHWPGKVVFAGREIGHTIYVGDRLKETSLNNPVRRAYQLHRERAKNGHWNHHTADPSAVILAVRGLSDYWDISDSGYLDIKPDCSFAWENDPQGNQRYIIQKMDRVELGNLMETLMIMPPQKK
jgi:inosine-uridine nucleoside N-ribohydrolase